MTSVYGSIDNSNSRHDAKTGVENNEKTSLLPNDNNNKKIDSLKFETEENASFLSKLTFGWMEPLIQLGNVKQSLDPEDINKLPLPVQSRSDYLRETFNKHWESEITSGRKSLMMALAKAYGFDCIVGGFILKFVHDSCVFVGPNVLNKMILFLESDEYPLSYGLMLTFLVTLSQLTMSFCLRHYFMKCYKFGLKIRTGVNIAVYEKALRLSAGERYSRSLGEITNLMSVDAQRLQDLTTYLHAVWFSFYQIGLALYMLWQQLGPSTLAGLFIICVMIPVTKFVAQYMAGLQKNLMKSKDDRVDVNSEVLGAMKVVKLQAWEEPFMERILKLREIELQDLLKYILANCLSMMLWSGVPLSVSLSTFAAYVFLGNDLDVATALTSVALFEILRFPLFMLPQIINRIVEARVSLDRVRSFLLCDDYKKIGSFDGQEKGSVYLNNTTAFYESFKQQFISEHQDDKELADKDFEISLLQSQLEEAEWKIKELSTKDAEINNQSLHAKDVGEEEMVSINKNMLCLKRINFTCEPGELVAVVGNVASGKSSLLSSIIGELRVLSGEIAVKGKLAYFCQNPFISNASLKDNVLFSHVDDPVIDEKLYQRSIESCALVRDLEILPAGDQTEIGEKGITLSGGQKARVALARAVYHKADLTLIDDALSAVDAHVSKHLFEECITKELLTGDRSVILATNALEHLNHPRVNKIVVLREGRIVEQGTYTDLAEDKNSEFSRFLSVMEETGIMKPSSSVDNLSSGETEEQGQDDNEYAEVETSNQAVIKRTASLTKDPTSKNVEQKKKTDNSKLMTTEERAIGRVGYDVYFYWAQAAGGLWVIFTIFFFYASVDCIGVLSKWWLTYWSTHSNEKSQLYFLGIFGLINFTNVIGIFVRLIFIMLIGLKASRAIYINLLTQIMHAPMSFFDTTPIGRIINRFSQDMYTIDSQLMMTVRSYITTMLNVLSAIVVCSSVFPAFIIGILPLIAYYVAQQRFFTMTYRELKRLDSVSRSPIYALLGETIDGVATIRAYDSQASLTKRLKGMLDRQQNAYYLLCVAQCWLAIRLELVGTLIITLACLFPVYEHSIHGGDAKFAGLAGLAISYALSITQSLNWSVRMASDLEANMISVERVSAYSSIQTEASRETEEDKQLSTSWPKGGSIQFNDSSLRYRPGLPLVLKGLNIELPFKSKIGVVGRTGAGKSTLMVSLLRIVELDSGSVKIDGTDISKLGLTKLRSNIAVIPQDPVLFSGTIRSNLDPFSDYSDEDISAVLERVGLFSDTKSITGNTSVTSLSSLASMSKNGVKSLNDPVKENGSNFSVGQRQLLVIARALLSESSIVIMDEATAAVDADTDARIQKVMRSEFANATCITIAHRINTIMDSDFILVMENGMAAEFDTPQTLIQKGGMFRDLVEAASHQE